MNLRGRLRGVIGQDRLDEAFEHSCQACSAQDLTAFYEVTAVPSQTCVLLDSADEALEYPVGDLLLGFCETCGFIQNTRFDPETVDYSKPTEESQAFSAQFNEFAGALASELVKRYELTGKTVLEVGCGKGDFLRLLGDRGIGHGIGIDPGFLPDRISGDGRDVEFLRRFYGPEDRHLTGDLVITRHLMEHIHNVSEFSEWLHESVSQTPSSALFTEVPDTERVLREGAFWDVYYEHCSYFTRGSLARSLRTAGFAVDWLRLGFDDQYLLAGAHPGSSEPLDVEESPSDLAPLVESFATTASAEIDRWKAHLNERIDSGSRIAVWGGGSKAIAFLSSLKIDDIVVVDINPFKQGKWLPSIAVEVQPPEILRAYKPDLVVVMNPVYVDEIREGLVGMDLYPQLKAA